MSELIAIIAVLGAIVGASLNTVRAYFEAPPTEGYSFKKLFGALIASSLLAISAINFVTIVETAGTLGYVALFVLSALAGVGISSVTHKSNK
jgi:hypothetical protein